MLDVNISAIAYEQKGQNNTLYTLEASIMNPAGNDKSYTLSLGGRLSEADGATSRGISAFKSFVEKEKEAIKVKALAEGKFGRAPNGEVSNLADTPELWCVVHTKAFKDRFGDWDTYARIQEIKNMPAVEITPHESLDKKQMKEVFRGFGEVQNKRDGRIVVFPSVSAGKIRRHKGFDSGTIVRQFGELFKNAVPDFREVEVLKQGHRAHPNYECYEHYVNKFSDGNSEYYIRFTVPVIRNNKERDKVHSTAISDIHIYEKNAPFLYPLNTAGNQERSFTDNKLKDFFNSVKSEEVSKVVDENGEPLVVYHYTDEQFSAFDPAMARVNSDIQALFFMDNAMDWQDMGGRKMECFLNIRKPVEKPMVDAVRNEAGKLKRDELIAQGYDGTFLTEDGATEWAAFDSSQVKSVDNRGTWDVGQDNINFSIRTEEPPKKTGIGYKVFYRGKDGKLYPPMVANPGAKDTPVGVWLDADDGVRAADSKTGRAQVKSGGKGTQGGSGTLAYRPGWHLGEIPYAIQFNRVNPLTGKKELFPSDFVWAEVEYAADVDYQEEAMSYGYTDKGKFRHSYAGLPRLPKDGFYSYRTNPNPDTDPWIITGAMKVNRVLSREEVDELVRKAGREPQMVEGDVDISMSVKGTPQNQADIIRSLRGRAVLKGFMELVDTQELFPIRTNPDEFDNEAFKRMVDVDFGPLAQRDIDEVKDQLPENVDLKNARHFVDVESIWHAYRKHALDSFVDVSQFDNGGKKTSEQIGITYDDIRMIPDIIENRDTVQAEKYEGRWHLKYTKKYGDVSYTYYEAISRVRDTKHRNTECKTVWLSKVVSTGGRYALNPTQPQSSSDSRFSSTAKILPIEEYIKLNYKKEVESIVANTNKRLLTPTKNVTKLMPAQWVAVRLKSFKAWFGDWEGDKENASEVVGEDGEPMVLYHQTEDDGFNEFEVGREGAGRGDSELPDGICLKPAANDIGLRGKVQRAFFVNARRMLHFKDRGELAEFWKKNVEGYSELCAKLAGVDGEYKVKLEEVEAQEDAWYAANWKNASEDELAAHTTGSERVLSEWGEAEARVRVEMKNLLNEWVAKEGYDGVHVERDEGSNGRVVELYEVFKSEQVKSATDNSGEFGVGNPVFTASLRDSGSVRTVWDLLAAEAGSAMGAEAEVYKAMAERLEGALERNGFTRDGVHVYEKRKDEAAVRDKMLSVLAVCDAIVEGLPRDVREGLNARALAGYREQVMTKETWRGRMNGMMRLVGYVRDVVERAGVAARLRELERFLRWARANVGENRVKRGKMNAEVTVRMEMVERALGLDADELEKAREAAEAAVGVAELKGGEEYERAQDWVRVLDVFGGLYGRDGHGRLTADLRRVEQALETVRVLYSKGRAAYDEFWAERRARVGELLDEAGRGVGRVEAVGVNERTGEARHDVGVGKGVVNMMRGFLSFENMLEDLFGEGKVAEYFSEGVRSARVRYNRKRLERERRYYAAMWDVARGVGVDVDGAEDGAEDGKRAVRRVDGNVKLGVRREVDRMVQDLSRGRWWGIMVKPAGKFNTERVRIEDARRWLAGEGEAEELPAFVMNERAMEALRAALDDLPKFSVSEWVQFGWGKGADKRVERIKVSTAYKWVNGVDAMPEWLAGDLAAQYALAEALDGVVRENKKEYVSFTWLEQGEEMCELRMSDLEAAYILQLSGMAEYADNLEALGFGWEELAALRDKIDARALAVADWISKEYEEGYGAYNEVYKRLFGCELPRVKNYAPGFFVTDNAAEAADPMEGHGSGWLTVGSIKMRRKHYALPRVVSCVNAYWAHHMQMDHWEAFAEVMRDMKGVLLNGELGNKVAAVYGDAARRLMVKWVEYVEFDGRGDSDGAVQAMGVVNRICGAMARGGLSYNFKTCLKQFPAMLSSLCDMAPGEALRGFLGVMQRPRVLGEVFKSEAVQQRLIAGMSPEMKQALTANRMKVSMIGDALEAGMLPISLTDAAFTSVSGAVAYEGARRKALKEGAEEEAAHERGLAAMDRAVRRTAQPIETEQKSAWEVQATSWGRMFMMFRSDPRKQLALSYMALSKLKRGEIGVGEAAWRFCNSWVLYGICNRMVVEFLMWLMGQDDEEEVDLWERFKGYAVSGAMGALSGIYGVAELAEVLWGKLSGDEAPRYGSGVADSVDTLWRGIDGVIDAANGDDVDYVRVINQLGRGLNGTGVLAAVGAPEFGALWQVIGRVVKDTDALVGAWSGVWDEEAARAKEQNKVIKAARRAEKEEKGKRAEVRREVFKAVRGLDYTGRQRVYAEYGLDRAERRYMEERLEVADESEAVRAVRLIKKEKRRELVDKLRGTMSEAEFKEFMEELKERGVKVGRG